MNRKLLLLAIVGLLDENVLEMVVGQHIHQSVASNKVSDRSNRMLSIACAFKST